MKNCEPNYLVYLKVHRTANQGSQLAACAIMPTRADRGARTAEYAKAHIHATRTRVVDFYTWQIQFTTYD